MPNRISNFGRNVTFFPKAYVQPESESELLEFLSQNDAWPVRCHGTRHAWSPLIETKGVLISLENFQRIQLVEVEGERRVRVGAGCKIKTLIAFLNQHQLTLPTMGLIDEQTVAGATATGTHGSGNHSLAHFISGVRLAHFNSQDTKWAATWIREGESLSAARCSLGALGVVTELEFPVRNQYRIEEHFAVYSTFESVLAAEDDYPLQQFFLIPWRWDYFAQHRRETEVARSWSAPLYRLFWLAGMDFALHLLICSLGKFLPWGSTPFLFRNVVANLIPRGWRVVDRADRQLTMQHDLFRHIEIELFVPRSKLGEMLDLVRSHVESCAGKRNASRYEHHYPICIRKILSDETLISPAAGGAEPWYSVSLISYNRLAARAGFNEFARDLAAESAGRLGARPHWGKVCPLNGDQLMELYPKMDQFRSEAEIFDQAGYFRSPWLCEKLGLSRTDN